MKTPTSFGQVIRTTLLTAILIFVLGSAGHAQNLSSNWSIGAKLGWDIPAFEYITPQLSYNGGRAYGFQVDYNSNARWGVRLDYVNIHTTPEIDLPDVVDILTNPGMLSASLIKSTEILKRNYFGIGPSYYFGDDKFYVLTALTVGYETLDKGDAHAFTTDGAIFNLVLFDANGNKQLGSNEVFFNTGFSGGSIAGKLDIEMAYNIMGQWYLNMGGYVNYIYRPQFNDFQHAGLAPSQDFKANWHVVGDFQPSSPPAVDQWSNPLAFNGPEKHILSYGIMLGLNYRFGL